MMPVSKGQMACGLGRGRVMEDIWKGTRSSARTQNLLLTLVENTVMLELTLCSGAIGTKRPVCGNPQC